MSDNNPTPGQEILSLPSIRMCGSPICIRTNNDNIMDKVLYGINIDIFHNLLLLQLKLQPPPPLPPISQPL